MAGWDDTPSGTSHPTSLASNIELTFFTAAAADGGFRADNSASNDAWAPQSTGGDDDDTGYIGENVSKHAGGDGDGCRK
jgi:hypothetical protein